MRKAMHVVRKIEKEPVRFWWFGECVCERVDYDTVNRWETWRGEGGLSLSDLARSRRVTKQVLEQRPDLTREEQSELWELLMIGFGLVRWGSHDRRSLKSLKAQHSAYEWMLMNWVSSRERSYGNG